MYSECRIELCFFIVDIIRARDLIDSSRNWIIPENLLPHQVLLPTNAARRHTIIYSFIDVRPGALPLQTIEQVGAPDLPLLASSR
jgi:hypothetical protein